MSTNSNKDDIRLMVNTSYERVIEGEGILADFDNSNLDVTNNDVSLFIDEIPEKTLKRWKNKLVNKTVKDFMNDVNGFYGYYDGHLVWLNSEVEDWQMNFYCIKIVKLYKKVNNIKDPIQLSIVDTCLECFIDKTCKLVHDDFYEKSLDVLMNRYPDVQADEPEGQLEAILDAQKGLTITINF